MALHHVVTGPAQAPVVFLGGSLGSTHRLWDELVSALPDYRVVAFDHRGHGQSPPASAGVQVADLAADVLALADALSVDSFHYVGISLGGAVGLTLALTAPERVGSLTAACTAPWFGGPEPWRQRVDLIAAEGMAGLRAPTAERWFTDRVRPTPRARQILDELVAQRPESYAACCGALGTYDLRDRLGQIAVPTTIIGAAEDPGTPVDAFAEIPGATTVVLADARHLANIDQPAAFAAEVRESLTATRE